MSVGADVVNFIRQNFQPPPSTTDHTIVEENNDGGGNSNSPEIEEAFGHVSFYGPSEVDNFFSAKYVRFDPRRLKSNQVVLDLLFKQWHLTQPRLIISVTGGARRFIMHNRILQKFNRSLLRAATSADALIVTNGLWKGVCRLIGEAAQSARYQQSSSTSRVQLLGISCWGVLQETNSLVNNSYVSPMEMKRYRVYDNFENEKVPAALDPNHHAFLLVDNGSFRKYGQEIPFRNELEDCILQNLGGVPGVLLVMEGGETTLKTTLEFLRKGRPVVLVDGLGGCGDLVSWAYRISEGMAGQPNTGCEDFVRFDQIMVTKCPHWTRYLQFKDSDAKAMADSKMHEANLMLFEACVGKRDFVSVVQINDADSLDSAILEANFKAAKSRSDPFQLLGLAIQWNHSDIASTYVFTSENMSNPSFFATLNEHHEYFLTAMKRDCYESALNLIEHGFNVAGRYLTSTELSEIYADLLAPGGKENRFVDVSLRTILNNLASNALDFCLNDYLLGIVGDLISDLIQGHFPNIYDTLGYQSSPLLAQHGTALSVIGQLARKEAISRIKSAKHDGVRATGDEDRQKMSVIAMATADGDLKKMPVPYPHRDLFICCVLLNRRQMALLMWRQFRQGGALAGALFAAAVLRGLANKAGGSMVELAQSLEKHAEFWEMTASNFADHCFQRDQAQAQLLLIRAVREFGNKTPFELAHGAGLKQFMCTSCCYTKLNVNWQGHLSATTPIWLITATIFCPLLIPAIKFRPLENESDYNNSSRSKVGADNDDADVLETMEQASFEATTAVRRVALRSSRTRVGLFRAIRLFYTAPVTKFIADAFCYAIYLICYSVFVLTGMFTPTQITPLETVIWIWTGVIILEEIRQIAMANGNFRLKLQFFWSNRWHRFDVVSYILFTAAVICHIVLLNVDDEGEFNSLSIAVLDLYDLALVMFFIRLLSFFYVSRNLGPKVITLMRMLLDVGFFFAIYIVLLLSFSVPIQSLLYPGSPFTVEIFEVVFYNFVLILFQMHNPEPKVRGRFDSISCIQYNPTDPSTFKENLPISQRCPQQNYLAIVLLCAYLIATSIVLLNLLIAMFSFTFNNVANVSMAVWRFNMYEFVLSYYNKSSLAPPLSIIAQIISVISYLTERIANRSGRGGDGDEEGGAANRHNNSPFVLYDEQSPSKKQQSPMLLHRKAAYQMSLLVRFETTSIDTFFEDDNNKEQKNHNNNVDHEKSA